MSDDEIPPDDFPSEPPAPSTRGNGKDAGKESRRSRLESVIPEILKRAVEIGVEKARESPENLKQFVHDLKIPKEITHYLFQQIDDTKNGLFRVVAKEIRDFLEHTNFAGEVQNLLTTVQFEVNTTIRFTPNDGRERTDAPTDEPDGEAAAEPNPDESTGSSAERPSRNPLPRPELKTAVRVRRDERRRNSRGGA